MRQLVFRGRAAHNMRRGAPLSPEAAKPDYISLYRQAFADYRAHALWYIRALENPSRDDAMVVARALRTNGDLPARRLAEQIEQACHAIV